jgi:hypothetical protein
MPAGFDGLVHAFKKSAPKVTINTIGITAAKILRTKDGMTWIKPRMPPEAVYKILFQNVLANYEFRVRKPRDQ